MALTSMIRICIFDSSMSPAKSKISFVHKLLRRSSFYRIDKTGAVAHANHSGFFRLGLSIHRPAILRRSTSQTSICATRVGGAAANS